MEAPKKGDLVYMQFDSQSGHEQSGYRPGIVLSPYSYNQTTRFAVICRITRQRKGYPFEVELPDGLNIESVILRIKKRVWIGNQEI